MMATFRAVADRSGWTVDRADSRPYRSTLTHLRPMPAEHFGQATRSGLSATSPNPGVNPEPRVPLAPWTWGTPLSPVIGAAT
jgi:hypothetical protein